MCGITGIINKSGQPVETELAKKINDLIHHRGPDGEGFFFHQNIVLGHRRLSIIDLSDNGLQPMHYKDRYTITYNGEVYNYIELKKELEGFGYSFKTQSDTEVILAAYDKWKTACFDKFNGMWSMALYDKHANTLICSRDRFGKKPFYYSDSPDTFVFGSEIKQILPFLKARKVNKKILMDFLVLNLTDHTDETFFEGIKTLRGGNLLLYYLNENKYSIQNYYTIKVGQQNTDKICNDTAIFSFQELFNQSIKLRLRSDVKVGTCLSGGLDSSLIAAVASKRHKEKSNSKFTAITAESIDVDTNEVEFARIVARALDLMIHTTTPSACQFRHDIEEVIKVHEEPFNGPSIVMQYYTMKAAREQGIKVLLDGQGADETLLGYSRYIAAIMANLSLAKKMSFVMTANKHYGISCKEVLATYLYNSYPSLRKIYLAYRSRGIKEKFLQQANWQYIDAFCNKFESIVELQKYEITTFTMPQLLKWEDKNAMHFSVETRLPFLDYKLVEHNLSLPTECKIKDGWSKIIIRKTMKGVLPDVVAWRKKKYGFNAPINAWLGDKEWMYQAIYESPIIQEIYKDKKPNISDAELLWRVYNTAVWSRIYNVTM